MEEIKPKKERKFLKAMGEIALVLFRELVLGIGKKVINKVGNKRQALAIAFVMVAGISYAAIDSIPYPITGNKQRLGWQTTGNGLVYRGTASDTVTKPSNYTNKDIKAYLLVDTVNNVMYSYIASKGGWQFNNSDTVIIQGATMPFDSITFNTAKDGTVGVGEMEYNDTQGSLIQGLKGGNVTNVIGQQLHQRVNNRTGATLNKGDVVYLSGSQGNRITVAKALATSDPTSANTFGIVAESIADNQSGYIITEGLITGLNTSALTQDSAVYLSGTTAGALTSTKPQAPIHGVYIGVCVESNNGNGKIFCKIRNGSELDELHDVQISSPFDKASLYYKSSDGLWRDTTAALLVSDTASMLTPYFRDADTTSLNLTSRFAAKLNISDTASMLTNYARIGTGGTVTNVTGTLPISVVNNTTTPAISIANASASVSGVVTTGTQSFAGAKTFTAATIINGGLVVNDDGSSVGIFRVEGDNTTSLIQTAPANDYVGIGRAPENSFDVQGAVRFRTLTLNGTPTRIIGADATGDINQITLGTGLSLSSGTLSATNTGTVTNVTGTLPISVANGTTTPSITIANASTTASGVVTTGTQSFAGAKTFTNIVGFNRAIQRPVETITVSSASITTSNTWVIVNNAGTVTLTFPSASASTGTEFHIKTITNNAVVSDANNIVPLAGGSASTSILSASAGKWATLVSDGSNWVIMQAN